MGGMGMGTGFMSPRLSSPAHPAGGGAPDRGGADRGFGDRNRGRGRGRGMGRDRGIIGQTIKITQGPYKGDFSPFCAVYFNCEAVLTILPG